MAHVGRTYKLAFRRDLGNVRFNANSWPEAFRYRQNHASGGVYEDNRDNKIPLINTAKEGQPPMAWTSAVRSYGGRPYIMTWSVDDPIYMQTGKARFDCHFTDNGEVIFKFTSSPGFFLGTPNNVSGFVDPNFQDSVFWKIDSFGMVWVVDAMKWADYNPA